MAMATVTVTVTVTAMVMATLTVTVTVITSIMVRLVIMLHHHLLDIMVTLTVNRRLLLLHRLNKRDLGFGFIHLLYA